MCVSSKSLAEKGTRGEPLLDRHVLAHLSQVANRTLYDDMRRMERLLRESGRDRTVIRPAGLVAADHVSDYRCTTGHEPGISTSTADLADALIREVVEDHQHVGEVLQVLTDADKPPYLLLLAKQASLHRL